MELAGLDSPKVYYFNRSIATPWPDMDQAFDRKLVPLSPGCSFMDKREMMPERGDFSEGQRSQVHGVVLQLMQVPVIYGLPVFDNSFETLIRARAALFPNARSHVLGGCNLIRSPVQALLREAQGGRSA